MKAIRDENLIFLHLPKNGGTTFHSILERIYPEDKTFSIRKIDNNHLNINEFKSLHFSERSKIKLLKGHMQFGLHSYLDGPSNYVTFLRRPEERIRSFYYFAIKRPEHRLYNKIMEGDSSLLHFVETMNEGDLHNGQIRWISGLAHGTEAEMLAKAKEHIDNHFSFVGLQEYYNESLLLLSNLYGWGTPYYKHRNRGSYQRKTTKDEAAISEAIAIRNKGDQELYNYVEERFLELLKEASGMTWKLKKLEWSNRLYSSYRLKKLRKLFQ